MVNFNGTPFTAKDYLRKHGPKLTLETTYLQAAEYVLTGIQKKISGNPASLAAGALYFVCKNKGIKISKDQIGNAFHVSGRTVYSSKRRITKIIESKNLRLRLSPREIPMDARMF